MTATARAPRHRKLLPYAAALVAVAGLGACAGSDPDPAATSAPPTPAGATTTTAAPTTTTKPTPTAPVDPVIAKIPAAALAATRTGAEAFASFFMNQVNKSFTEPSPESLTGLFGSACRPCAAFQSGAKDLKTQGRRHLGRSITPDAARSNSLVNSKAVVAIYVTQHSVPVVNASGKKVDQTEAGTGTFIATMSYNKHWVIDTLELAK